MRKIQYRFLNILIAFLMLVSASVFAAEPIQAQDTPTGTTYYVDAEQGDDTEEGTSENKAWKSLDKVNETEFQAGDRILFKAGQSWVGELHPKGSGLPGKRIVISKYGDGQALPHINAYGAESAVKLFNQEHWKISNLELSNDNGQIATSSRRGIYILGSDYKIDATKPTDLSSINEIKDIYIHDNLIHDIKGEDKKDGDGSAGIQFSIRIPGIKDLNISDNDPHQRTRFNGVVIENNTIKNVNRSGIIFWSDWLARDLVRYKDTLYGDKNRNPWTPALNVEIRANKLYDIGGDGIAPHMTDGTLVEYNFIDGFNTKSTGYNAGMWVWNADNTLFQYNEATGGVSTRDGMPWDFDQGSDGVIYQYNYSYGNDGGTLLFCSEDAGEGVKNGTFRYNIAQNDKYQTFTTCGGSAIKDVDVYNNVFYVGEGMNTQHMVNQGGSAKVNIFNNVFINHGTKGYINKPSFTLSHNAFAGNHIPTKEQLSDPFMITEGVTLQDPGKATTVLGNMDRIVPENVDWSVLDGYKIQKGSSLINSGRFISLDNPVDQNVEDFFTKAQYNGHPDIGAHEYTDEVFEPVEPYLPELPRVEAKILNGDFDNTAQQASGKPWTYHWGGGINKDPQFATSGSYSGMILPTSAAGSVEQTFAVEPNSKYRISGQALAGAADQQLFFGYKFNEQGNLNSKHLLVDSLDFKEYELEFVTGTDTSTVTLYFYKEAGSLVASYVDDVRIEELSQLDLTQAEKHLEDIATLVRDTYTTDSLAVLDKAVESLKAVMKDFSATQAELDQAIEGSKAAVKALEEKKPSIPWTELTPSEKDTTIPWTELTPSEKDTTIPWTELTPSEKDTTIPWTELTPSEKDTTIPWTELTPSEKDSTTPWTELTPAQENPEQDATQSESEETPTLPATGLNSNPVLVGGFVTVLAGIGLVIFKKKQS